MDTNKLYNDLVKYVGNKITRDNVFKAVVYLMKAVKKWHVSGEEKKRIVIDIIFRLAVNDTALKDYVDRELIDITIEMVYESFKTDVFKKGGRCC